MQVFTTDEILLKPVDMVAAAEREARERGRRYHVRPVEARFEEAYSFEVKNLKTSAAYAVDIYPATEGYRARCSCDGFLLGGCDCVHIRKALIVLAALNRAERRLYAEEAEGEEVERPAPTPITYDFFLEITGLADDREARRLYDEYNAGELPLDIPQ